jgi:GNAT superfamily N-acetyltransferase
MLDVSPRAVGHEFRGAVQTGVHHYLAVAGRRAVGYIDCGTFDRCTVYAGEGPLGPIITESLDVAAGSIAFVIDPEIRRRGLGGGMIRALTHRPELAGVGLSRPASHSRTSLLGGVLRRRAFASARWSRTLRDALLPPARGYSRISMCLISPWSNR